MTRDASVIKSFLVGLGFGVDDAELAKFNKAISSASLKVAALYGATKLMATGIVYGLSKISEGFEKMGYEYRIIAPAINKALVLRRELLKAYSAAGINITKVIQSSVRLNMSLTKTKFAFEAIYRSVGSRFFDLLTKQSDLFRQKIYANMPKIQATLERLIKFVFKAVEATTTLGLRLWSILTRVYDFFVVLDRATDGWSTKILAVVAAWKLLNLAFLATPLGLIITGLVALLALWDDLQTFREGGKSLFNWGQAIPIIDFITQKLVLMGESLQWLWGLARDLVATLSKLSLFQGIADIGAKVAGFLINPNVAANLQNAPQGVPGVAPIGSSNVQNSSQTNQTVQQQTSIHVQGVADANAVGRAVSGEQSKVNFDLVRNLKGATR